MPLNWLAAFRPVLPRLCLVLKMPARAPSAAKTPHWPRPAAMHRQRALSQATIVFGDLFSILPPSLSLLSNIGVCAVNAKSGDEGPPQQRRIAPKTAYPDIWPRQAEQDPPLRGAAPRPRHRCTATTRPRRRGGRLHLPGILPHQHVFLEAVQRLVGEQLLAPVDSLGGRESTSTTRQG